MYVRTLENTPVRSWHNVFLQTVGIFSSIKYSTADMWRTAAAYHKVHPRKALAPT